MDEDFFIILSFFQTLIYPCSPFVRPSKFSASSTKQTLLLDPSDPARHGSPPAGITPGRFWPALSSAEASKLQLSWLQLCTGSCSVFTATRQQETGLKASSHTRSAQRRLRLRSPRLREAVTALRVG